jgi:hypothetical protein
MWKRLWRALHSVIFFYFCVGFSLKQEALWVLKGFEKTERRCGMKLKLKQLLCRLGWHHYMYMGIDYT